MSTIKNPTAYWLCAYKNEKNKQFNKNLEYFLANPYSKEQRIFDIINVINTNGKQFEYITSYQPYNQALKTIPNLIIDMHFEKLILIPNFTSLDNSRTFNDKNYHRFKIYIQNIFTSIPSEDFLNFINKDRYMFTYVANNFEKEITYCEKINSIKILINPMEYKISIQKIAKIKPVIPVPASASSAIPVLAPALKPRVVVPEKEIPKPISNSISEMWKSIGSTELMNEFINEDLYCAPSIKKLEPVVEVSKPKYLNLDDPKLKQLKDSIIRELSGNPNDKMLTWLNSLFHNIFNYTEFIQLVTRNEYLIIDMQNQKLIRKQFSSKSVFNPEDDF